MAEPLKNMYNPRFFEGFTTLVKEVLPEFQKQEFYLLSQQLTIQKNFPELLLLWEIITSSILLRSSMER